MATYSQLGGRRGYARFCWGVLAYNLFVVVWGAFVRASGAGAGCGSHWPLCNGEVVPRAPAIETLIEFGHRLTSGVALLLVMAMVYLAWRRYPAGHRVRAAAAASLFFIITEALIGAGLVLLELVADNASSARGFWVTGHLVNTFLLVACLTLTAWWASGAPGVAPRRHGALSILFALTLSAMLLLGASGAVTALGDTLFPVATFAEGKEMTFAADAHLFVRLRIWHPTLALVVGALVAVCAFAAVKLRSESTVRQLAAGTVAVLAAQLVLGMANMWLLAPIPLQLAHLLLSDLLWILLVLLAASALRAE
jgi:heme A synthase